MSALHLEAGVWAALPAASHTTTAWLLPQVQGNSKAPTPGLPQVPQTDLSHGSADHRASTGAISLSPINQSHQPAMQEKWGRPQLCPLPPKGQRSRQSSHSLLWHCLHLLLRSCSEPRGRQSARGKNWVNLTSDHTYSSARASEWASTHTT